MKGQFWYFLLDYCSSVQCIICVGIIDFILEGKFRVLGWGLKAIFTAGNFHFKTINNKVLNFFGRTLGWRNIPQGHPLNSSQVYTIKVTEIIFKNRTK